jgi:hypothetical protein
MFTFRCSANRLPCPFIVETIWILVRAQGLESCDFTLFHYSNIVNRSVQFASGGSNLALLLHSATHVLRAIADRLLVYVQSDVTHMSPGASWSFSESASPLSSAYATPHAPQ